MRLTSIYVESAEACRGLLDGLRLGFDRSTTGPPGFFPLCFVGPNGAGKSQLLQVIAEAFQSLLAAVVPKEERADSNPTLRFEIEYETDGPDGVKQRVRFGRRTVEAGGRRVYLRIRSDGAWRDVDLESSEARRLVPEWIVAYTSGDNETLSLPFFRSRANYADEVAQEAREKVTSGQRVPRTRLMLVDYGTNLEVLVANLAVSKAEIRSALLEHADVHDLHSFRCVIQLNHPKGPKVVGPSGEKGVQLTQELREYIDRLKGLSTCWDYEPATRTYVLDYYVDDATRKGFRHLWGDKPFELYESLHKLAMLNDLMVPRSTRHRLRGTADHRQFASRLPEAHDEEKVFRFESVRFRKGETRVDYAALSDGEHQLLQLLGTFAMLSNSNVVFLLDEPESHFNPQWRVHFLSWMSSLREQLAAAGGAGGDQDCILTTHAPFVPSDLPRNQVVVFSKRDGRVEARAPRIETFGASFDTLLDECFDVRPPMSARPRKDIEDLLEETDVDQVRRGIQRLGHSVDKAVLLDHYDQLLKNKNGP